MDGGGSKKGPKKKIDPFLTPPLRAMYYIYYLLFPDLSLEISGNSGDLFFVDLWGSLGSLGITLRGTRRKERKTLEISRNAN